MHGLSLFNSLSKTKEAFIPLSKDDVKMYVCGPTVYDNIHLGNARSAIVYDILYRVLIGIYGFNAVKFVRNITDVDDKIINKAKELGISETDVSGRYIKDFDTDMVYLNCKKPTTEPKATEYIPQIIELIETLLQKKHAYLGQNGDVYFSVKTCKFYGELSNREIEDMILGSRVEVNVNKTDGSDFVLWKKSTVEQKGEICWEASFGIGRPGWHSECVAMSVKNLGKNFDIHGGGMDLSFPHHENEIAQAKCAFDNCSFAKYWVHNGFLMVGGQKMSKSLKNFITVKNLRDKQVLGEAVRFAFCTTHYRKPIDFSDSVLSQSGLNLQKFCLTIKAHLANTEIETTLASNILINEIETLAKEAILDDLNLPKYIAVMHTINKDIKYTKDVVEAKRLSAELLKLGVFIGIFTKKLLIEKDVLDKAFDDGCKKNAEGLHLNQSESYNKAMQLGLKRLEARKMKNFQDSDNLRDQILKLGYKIEDTANGEFILYQI